MKFSSLAQHKYSCVLHTYNLTAGAFQSYVANLVGRHMNIAVRCFICPGSRSLSGFSAEPKYFSQPKLHPSTVFALKKYNNKHSA